MNRKNISSFLLHLSILLKIFGIQILMNGIKANPIIRMVNPGDRVHIPCSVMHPGGSVQWVRNGKPILLDFSPTQRRHWNISNDGQASLTINRVHKADEGIWECWELDSLGNVKQKAHVMKLVVTNIPEEPFLQLDGKRLELGSKITVREANTIKIDCTVKGASPAVHHIHWFIDGHNLTEKSQLLMEYFPDEDNYETKSVLTINVTKVEHQKLVICQAEHISWERPAVVTSSFNVLYEPSFSISREPGFGYPIMEGMAILLKCEIDANPSSKPSWIKENIVNKSKSNNELTNAKDNDGILNITSSNMSDTGWYRCVTDHEFGHFESFGYFLHVRKDLPKLQHVLKLPLSPSSGTLNNLMLGKDNGFDISSDLSSLSSSSVHPNESLRHKSISSSSSSSTSNSMDIMVNSGFYSNQQQIRNGLQNVFGENTYDERNNNNNINNCDPNGRPIVNKYNRTVSALVGQKLTLHAEFCCNPRPRMVFWIHRHLAMTPGRIIGPYLTKELIMTSSSQSCYTSEFEIDSVKPEDNGEISFVVVNQKGFGGAIILINITRAGYATSLASSQHHNNWTFIYISTLIIIWIFNSR